MNLMTESLWGDEAFSALAVMKSFPEMIGVVMRDTAPPFFYVVGFWWARMFGSSEVALRSLTTLLMMGAAIFAGLIVYAIDRDKFKGLSAGTLALISPFLVPFAFEWRMYALLTFTVTASTYFFVTKKWGWYVGFALAALYTHHFAIFTVFAQGIWFLLTDFPWGKPKKWLREIQPFLLIGLGYSLWLYPMYIQVTRVKGSGFWLSVPKPNDLFDLLGRFATGGVTKIWQLIVGGLAAGLLLVKDWKGVGENWSGLLFIFLAPIGLAYVLSQVITPIFYDRYLLSGVIGSAVLIVLGTPRRFFILAAGLILIYGLASWGVFNSPKKRPFRDFAAYVKSEIKPTDKLINFNGRAHHLWETKYYGIPAPIYTPNGPLPLYVGTALMGKEDTVEKLPEVKGRLGVITSEPPDKIGFDGYKLLESKQFGELAIVWLVKR